MAVYATAPRPASPGRAARWSWLLATTARELDVMGARLGLNLSDKFGATATDPAHYVISTEQRGQALGLGALPATAHTVAALAAESGGVPDLFAQEQ